ncbi:MAG: isopeptide-forming domain-containing fimbrial protein, partial [Oscillospiraceae bacterium]
MKAKKIVSFIAAMAIAATMAIPATLSFAEDTTTTTAVTLKHSDGNNYAWSNYKAYKIFKGDLSTDGKILSNVEWAEGVDGTALLAALKADSTVGSAFAACTDAKSVAEVLGTTDNSVFDSDVAKVFAKIAANNVATAAGTVADDGTITLTGAGYYVISATKDSTDTTDSSKTDTAVARDFLIFANGEAKTPIAKDSYPTVTKKVADDATGAWQDITDQEIGKTVSFKLTGTLPSTYADYTKYEYTFHDTLSAGLTFNDDIKVMVGDKDVTSSFTTTSLTSIKCADLKAIKNDDGTEVINKDSQIVVTYTATVNENAVIGNGTVMKDDEEVAGIANPNEVYLEYTNNPKGTGTGVTPKDVVTVVTFKLDVLKDNGKDSSDTEYKKLSGAVFTLQNAAGEYYDAATKTWVAQEKTLTTDSEGKIAASGLKEGTYTLTEQTPPDGYNLLANPVITFTVKATYNTTDGEVNGEWTDDRSPVTQLEIANWTERNDVNNTTPEDATNGVSLQVINKPGTGLPETGGMGRTVLYVCGGIVVLGAGVLLIT